MYIQKSSAPPSDPMIDRIIRSYRLSIECASDLGDSLWAQVADWNKEISDAILRGDHAKVGEIFNNPVGSNLFYGFEPIFQWKRSAQSPAEIQAEADFAGAIIQNIGMIVGAVRVNNPEAPNHNPPTPVSNHDVIDAISAHIGKTVTFPNPYAGECGIEYRGQIVSVRAAQALYQALRVISVSNLVGSKTTLEIGAGLGRAAFFSYSGGLRDYTIIDIPLTAACQAHFLASVLGEDAVTLFGETENRDSIRILPPSSLADVTADVVVNVDSLTEMDRSVAQNYVDHAMNTAKALFMINHEVNSFRSHDLLNADNYTSIVRYPCPIRSGYMEEIIVK